MGEPVHVGIDLGTSGVRACAIDTSGRSVGEARQVLPASSHPQTGWSEQDPADWWGGVLAVLDLLLKDFPDTASLCVDGTSSTLLLVTPGGEPLTPGLMYDDQRALPLLPLLEQTAPPDSAVRSPSSALAKLLWLQRHSGLPAGYRAAHQADWVAGRLTGKFGVTDENNALKLGYDPVQRTWPVWLEECLDDATVLPRACAVGATLGWLTPGLARRWNLRRPVRIVAGTTDSNAATLASGVRQIGDAATALGSTLVLKILADRPVFASEFGVYSHRIGDHWLVGGASNSGGAVLLQHFTPTQLASISEHIDPQADSGLDYYPLPAPGERFPLNDPELPPRLEPWVANETQRLHGLLEGIARVEQLGYRRLHELGCPLPRRVFSTGGGAVNPTWRAIRQRLLGCPVLLATYSEAAYGSALIAAGRHVLGLNGGTAKPGRSG